MRVRDGKTLLVSLRAAAARELDRQRAVRSGTGTRFGANVDVRSPHQLVLGARVFVDAGAVLHCGGMEWSPDDGGITIGDDVYIGPNAVLFGAAGITLGDGTLIGPGVVITSHGHGIELADMPIREQPLVFGQVVLEQDVWIGANATVLPGVRLGRGSVVGAGAVVTQDVPAGAVVMGVPARIARMR